ncbi:hypothetical protein ACFQ0I_02775 [Mariniflexile aquimaris]|uniref:Uncharacterized protein n=1 Tax=Mariniflexile aquimaris TaxID=881009 RepID=A0ABW3BQ50_9FLAO
MNAINSTQVFSKTQEGSYNALGEPCSTTVFSGGPSGGGGSTGVANPFDDTLTGNPYGSVYPPVVGLNDISSCTYTMSAGHIPGGSQTPTWYIYINCGTNGGSYEGNMEEMDSKTTNTSTCAEVTGVIGVNPNEACGDGYVFDYELNTCVVDDKIDASGLTGKAECVYTKMVDNNNNINWILENFQDRDKPSQFNLIFQMSTTLGDKTNASTATPLQSGIPNTFVININQNRAENINTSLTVARTIIHEGIHARLWEFAYRNGGTVSQSDFPGVYEFMRTYGKNWDHEQMAAYYRETIAAGLKQFDNGQHTDEYYNALAWEGLSEIEDANNSHALIYTQAWQKLMIAEQQKVLQIITDEKANGSKECE